MGKMKSFIVKVLRRGHSSLKGRYHKALFRMTPLGLRGYRCQIGQPSLIVCPQRVFMHDYARLGAYNIVLNHEGRFVMGKYSVASTGLSVVPDMHISTVGIPHCCLGVSHVHDKVMDIIVEEDVWIGMNVTLLGGCHIERGCIVGANSLVNRTTFTPPYSVVAGSPARIVAVKFSIEQILRHEQKLYPPEERLSRERLEELFDKYYKDKRVFGVDGELTEEEQEKLENAMCKLGFRYSDFGENGN